MTNRSDNHDDAAHNPSPTAAEAGRMRDVTTLALMVADDPEGMRRLLLDHGGTVRNGLRRTFGRTLDNSDLEDALGAAIANIWQARLRFDPKQGTLRGWLFVIARNCALNLLATRRPELVSLDQLEILVPDLRNPAAEAERLQLALDLHRCLTRLPTQSRVVLNADLAAGGTASTTELAASLGTTVNSIYVARSRGRLLLRKQLHRLGYSVNSRPLNAPHPITDPELRLG